MPGDKSAARWREGVRAPGLARRRSATARESASLLRSDVSAGIRTSRGPRRRLGRVVRCGLRFAALGDAAHSRRPRLIDPAAPHFILEAISRKLPNAGAFALRIGCSGIPKDRCWRRTCVTMECHLEEGRKCAARLPERGAGSCWSSRLASEIADRSSAARNFRRGGDARQRTAQNARPEAEAAGAGGAKERRGCPRLWRARPSPVDYKNIF